MERMALHSLLIPSYSITSLKVDEDTIRLISLIVSSYKENMENNKYIHTINGSLQLFWMKAMSSTYKLDFSRNIM